MTDYTKLWAVGEQERLTATTADEAIQEFLDGLDPLAFVQVGEVVAKEYAPMHVSLDADRYVELALEDLDEEYGDPDGYFTKPTDGMKAAAEVFIAAIIAEYRPWMCVPTGIEVRVNAMEWVREHRPDWLAH